MTLALLASAAVVAGARTADPPAAAPDPIASLPCRQVQPASAPPPTWSSPDDPRARAELARWCQTIGPVIVRPATTPAEGPIDSLAIVSWNLHVGAGDVDRFVARLRAGEFTAGRPVNHFVLLLQEAYRRDDAIPVRIARGFPVPGRIAAERNRGFDVNHFWRDGHFSVLYAPSMRNGIVDLHREDRGNAIVSTLPLERPALIELPLERQRRVAAVSTVRGVTRRGTPWRVRVVDVHLDTALALTRGGPFAARQRQVDALIASLRATADRDDAGDTTVVAGDFNTWGGRERALDTLAKAFPDAHDSGSAPTWVGPLGMHATLDHIFAAGPARITIGRLADRFGSDHHPLLATLAF